MAYRPARSRFGHFMVWLIVMMGIILGGPAMLAWKLSGSSIYTVDAAPSRDVTLVFGAAMWGKAPSPYLQYRLDVAAALYKAGKTKVIIVSGTRDGGYSEPDGMKAALIAEGVPANRIVPDYGGNDTYSSCLRARDVFGVKSLIAVTQSYHLPRAVATCQMLLINAVGVGDDTVAHDALYRQYQIRELFGNVKMIYDVATKHEIPDMTPSDAVKQALAQG